MSIQLGCTPDYLVIADNQIVEIIHDSSRAHEEAQLAAKSWSEGRYATAKVIYLPNCTMQGHWHKGERLQ